MVKKIQCISFQDNAERIARAALLRDPATDELSIEPNFSTTEKH